jgi:simple sugar transport system permease protein
MTAAVGAARARLSIDRRFLPLSATIAMFAIIYAVGFLSFPAMRGSQPLFNLLITQPFLLICVVGETFVIISGGIDLSVGGVIALTTVVTATLLQAGWDPIPVIVIALLIGVGIGAVMGFFITYLKVQPFIATLAGMWFARGMCYLISDAEIRIYHPAWRLLAGTKILIPGLADPVTRTGSYVTVLVVIALLVLAAGLYIAHFTRFGRTVYAMGGNNGGNEVSARLMGLSVNRTKMMVYTLNGFCSALAGLVYSIYVGSGHGTHAFGMELTVIAAVVIGGTALTGGEGYLLGGLFGVLITGLIQSLIQYNGQLSSWWTSIVIGLLMLLFIGVQSVLATLDRRRLTRGGAGSRGGLAARLRDRRVGIGAAAVVLLVIGWQALGMLNGGTSAGSGTGQVPGACQPPPMRQDQAAAWTKDGAVIVYERNGGGSCIEELFAIYPDGRIVGDDGTRQVTATVTPDSVSTLVASLESLGWFTDDMYSTSHKPCAQCYTYFTTVTSNGQSKTVQAVDGGTDAPAKYWLATSRVSAVLPKFTTS